MTKPAAPIFVPQAPVELPRRLAALQRAAVELDAGLTAIGALQGKPVHLTDGAWTRAVNVIVGSGWEGHENMAAPAVYAKIFEVIESRGRQGGVLLPFSFVKAAHGGEMTPVLRNFLAGGPLFEKVIPSLNTEMSAVAFTEGAEGKRVLSEGFKAFLAARTTYHEDQAGFGYKYGQPDMRPMNPVLAHA